MLRYISCILIFLVMAFIGCDRIVVENMTGDIPVLTPVDSTVMHQTNDDVTWRRYTFANISLQFNFSDSIASVITYGNNYHKKIADIFYTKAMIQKSGKLVRNYDLDLEYFTADPIQYQLNNSCTIEFGKRSYILCVFDKQQFSVGPLNAYFYCLIDTTDSDAVSAIGFTNRLPEGTDVLNDIYNKNGHLCISMHYYTHIGHKGYKTVMAIITQNEHNEWVVR